MPKKWASVPAFIITAGLAIALISVLAESLGLDRTAGWGTGRIALLLFGTMLTLAGAARWRKLAEQPHDPKNNSTAGPSARAAQPIAIPGTNWPAISLAALVVLIYVWFATSGTWTTWTSQTRYYADLAHGFQKGHLYLAIKVPASLINSPDPYEPTAPWVSQGPIDYSYYQGHYYLAWGPVPALLVWLVRVSLQYWLGDLQLTFGFLCGIFLVECLLLLTIWNRFLQAMPRWMLWAFILPVGLAGPSTFMLNNVNAGRIYDAAVTGGQFFLLSGLLCALPAFEKQASSRVVALAGVFWALAIGTRPDLVLPVGVMVLAVSVSTVSSGGWSANTVKQLGFLCAPLLLGGVLLGWYNWARFGSVLETGYFYQMAGVNIHRYWNERFSLSYVIPNLYGYLLNPVLIMARFPFIQVQAETLDTISGIVPIPHFYYVQMLTGILWSAPFVVFAIVPLKSAISTVFGRQRAAADVEAGSRHTLALIELTLALSGLMAFGLVVYYFWAATRFLENFVPTLFLLCAIGFWQGYGWLSGRRVWQRLYISAGVLLVAASLAISVLGAVSALTVRFQIAELFPFLAR